MGPPLSQFFGYWDVKGANEEYVGAHHMEDHMSGEIDISECNGRETRPQSGLRVSWLALGAFVCACVLLIGLPAERARSRGSWLVRCGLCGIGGLS